MFIDNFNQKRIYKPSEIADMIESAMKDVKINKKRQYRKASIEYYNCPAAFDIETSSFIDSDGNKTAIMYEWTFGVNGLVMIGRTWEQWLQVCNTVSYMLDLNENRRLIIGVHNLGYEFQFTRKRFTWFKVFAVDIRKPVYAVTNSGLEFRDTYVLSGYKLEIVGKNLHKYKVEKMVGDLDYSKIRNSETPLTEQEIGYCVNDVQVVQAYLQECIESERNITAIPLTKTGYVRRFVRRACFGQDEKEKNYKRWNYYSLMQSLTLTSFEYRQLKKAFQGGFTHASPFYSGLLCEDVQSMDLTSSYPTQLCLPRFPMSKGEPHEITSKEDFEHSLKYYCCLFDVDITGLESKFLYDAYISRSRCTECEKPVISNGRVVSAEHIRMTITEQDYNIIRRVYTWSSCKVGNMIRYQRGYLPKDFVRAVLTLYKSKTELKGLQGNDENGVPYSVTYLSRKEMLNACYGMTVTDIVRDEITYTDEWLDNTPDLNEAIKKYNESKNRFLFYPWGVWTTACARVAVWSAILSLKDDYIYCDTDSVKYMHPEKHADYFEKYNNYIVQALKQTCKHFGFSEDYIAPLNNKGKPKQLGVWDFDGSYKEFKTLGAKRYMIHYSDDERNGNTRGEYNLTVSGLNKSVTVPYLINKYGKDKLFSVFDRNLYIPPDYTGKNTHTYIDDERKGSVTDYLGNKCNYDELSCTHLGGSDYSLSISQEYSDFLLDIQEGEI